jgi:hypothetical protein
VQAWLLIAIGVLSGPLFDMGYFRSMLFAGNFLVVLGIMMLSLCDKYWQVFLAQGVCMGLGAGLLYIPSLALVGIWFEKKRAIAFGIVMSGIAVGTSAMRPCEHQRYTDEERRRHLHCNVQQINYCKWLPLGHPWDGICSPRLRPYFLSRAPLRFVGSRASPKSPPSF